MDPAVEPELCKEQRRGGIESSEWDHPEILLSGGSCSSVLGNFCGQSCLSWLCRDIYVRVAWEWPRVKKELMTSTSYILEQLFLELRL